MVKETILDVLFNARRNKFNNIEAGDCSFLKVEEELIEMYNKENSTLALKQDFELSIIELENSYNDYTDLAFSYLYKLGIANTSIRKDQLFATTTVEKTLKRYGRIYNENKKSIKLWISQNVSDDKDAFLNKFSEITRGFENYLEYWGKVYFELGKLDREDLDKELKRVSNTQKKSKK